MKNSSTDVRLYINMQMIVDDLEDDYHVSFFQKKESPEALVSPEIYYGQKELRRDTLYVAASSVFEEHPIKDNKICRVAVGPTDTASGMEDFPTIVVKGSVNWQEIYNRIQKSFNRYISWHNRLLSIVDGGGGLYELCVAGMDLFNNPLYIHDENFNILAMPMWVVGMTEIVIDENTGNMSVSLKTLKKLKTDKEYKKTMPVKRAALWNPKHNAHRVLYVNIWGHDDRYLGRLLIQELYKSFKPGDFRMAEHFGKILTLAFERNLFKTSSVTTFEEVLKNMYLGEAMDDSYLSNRMKMVGWEKDHEFICMATASLLEKNSVISLKKVSSTISMLMKKSFSFTVDDMVYTICDLTLAETDQAGCESALKQLSDSLDTRSGISMSFHDIRRFPDYCRQADKALEMGNADADSRVVLFSENVLSFIITHFQEEFPVDMVASEAVTKLMEFDKGNDTEYLRTLRLYLENGMQQTLTANELFIHRSTLIYRIKKIEEMTGIDLSDPETRLYIQISIRLLI